MGIWLQWNRQDHSHWVHLINHYRYAKFAIYKQQNICVILNSWLWRLHFGKKTWLSLGVSESLWLDKNEAYLFCESGK